MTRIKTNLIITILLFCAGCDAAPATPPPPPADFITATLPPTATPASTHTPAPPTQAPTTAPIPGTTTTEVNVRADTSTASESLGTIPPFSSVQITGRDSSGLWYQILFNGGAGWVRADYIQAGEAAAEIPIVGGGSSAGSRARGVVLRGVNVRSGPGRDFDSLGLLNQNDVVVIFAKDSSGAWMQVEYPPAPDDRGWIAAEFLQIDGADLVQVLEEESQTAETEIPAASAASPEIAARMDGDSADSPLAMFTLSFDSAGSIRFQGEVSLPGGDGEDWIGFTSQFAEIVIQIACFSGGVQVELTQTGHAPIGCGGAQLMQVVPNQAYRIRILPVPLGDWSYSKYEVRIAAGN